MNIIFKNRYILIVTYIYNFRGTYSRRYAGGVNGQRKIGTPDLARWFTAASVNVKSMS